MIIDQIFKFWIKTNMVIGEEIPVFGKWFILHFVENKGMAFGLELGGDWGKLCLSLFRIVAITGIGWYWLSLIKKDVHIGLIISISFILTGAIGNILDSAFYGLIFNESTPYNVAQFMPEGGGYAKFLYGNVVDMLYFPLYEGFLPSWVPFWGDEYFIFFRPVFNMADSCITIGVCLILIFQRKFIVSDK